MALITNKFIFFDSKSKFDTRKNANEIPSTSIAFVYETETVSNVTTVKHSFIYTQGKTFKCDFDPSTISAATLETILGDYYLKTSDLQTSAVSSNTTHPVTGKAVTDAIAAAIQGLDVPEVDGSSTGQAVIKIKEDDGKITATLGNVSASHVTYAPTDSDTQQTTVQNAIHEIYGKITNGDITVERTTGGTGTWDKVIHADGNTYSIKKGTETIAQINIARDMVVSSGSVVTATGNETDVPTETTLTVGQKYVRLVVKNSSDGKNIYIPVNELYDDYNFTDTTEINFTETNNTVTAEINTGSVAKTKLTTALQNEITSARTTITEISQTNPASKHILVTKTAGTGATPDNYVISETDIASDTEVKAIPRIQAKSSGFVQVSIGNGDAPTATVTDTIGTLPATGTGSDATSVIDYVDKKVSAIGGENLWEHGTSNSSTKTRSGGTTAAGNYSLSAGDHTATNNPGEAALGSYNVSSTGATAGAKTMFSVGIGDNSQASNGIEVRADGSIYLYIDKGSVGGAEYSKLQDELEWWIEP